ncbi:two-component system sensor histidine kinase QseC [Modicisalibacter xianhensis]|uniref:histidine kinase n=1 Tax=Modicisalibacter xianhensis TaxID=442341 RepID=A0A4V3GUI6_9GAMM|nr:ATP-binding protein [Halomonas xianhensis]TDX31061.1 two-component system sensor histidine kinase QseC [Halomonas xianhensis]
MISIRRRTLGVVLLVFGISMSVIGVTSYHDAAHEVEELYDANLAQNARLLEGLTHAPLANEQRNALLASLNNAFQRADLADKRIAGHRYESKLAFQLWEGDRLLLRSSNAPTEPFTERLEGYTYSSVAGHEWRIYALNTPQQGQRVIVGEREDVRGELVTLIALRTLIPDLLGLPVLALLLWWAIGWGLRPLSQVANAIRKRDPHNLQPLAVAQLPGEIMPIAEALNRLLERIRQLRVREKRFIADAAHELRTPLAVLDLHAQNALTTESAEDRRDALDQLRDGVMRATRLVSQLLTLARLDPEADALPSRHAVNVLHEVREALAKLSPLASERGQLLQLEADEKTHWQLSLEPGAIDTLIQNLVGNALQHSPEGSTIHITLERQDAGIRMIVDDQGPGIPADERARATERFYRAGPGAGAGLGLSIVERLLERHGGWLALEDAPAGGLRVVATLP